MKKIYLTLALLLLAGYNFVFSQATFYYTGSIQYYTVPPGITQLSVDVSGAQGQGNADANLIPGNNGGRVQGTMTVTPCEVLGIFVGGGGNISDTNGGWNGGGNGGVSYFDPSWGNPVCPTADGGGGGGASDIRVAPYALTNRMVVGGGGGGTGGDRITCCGPGAGGGGGGGYYGGGGGGGYSGLPGTGGSQVTGGAGGLSPGCNIYGGMAGYNGSLGIGGMGGEAPGNCQFGPNPGCQGGPGGTLVGGTGPNCTGGGCPGTWSGGSGGGGSNYADPTMVGVTQTQGYETGNGIIVITPIGNSSPLVLAISSINPICGNCNGSISAIVSGGSTPYTYSWAPGGQTNATATGLCAGTYTITVTDLCGDIATDSVTLTSTSILVTASITANEPCNGNCVGSANTVVSGGASPYIYLWAPMGSTNTSVSALCAGSYTIAVKDVNGCTGTASITITQPAPLAATATGANILCYGGTGNIASNVTGGTSPYTYLWTPGGGTNANGTGITAGTYTMAVVDSNGCTASASATLIQPAAGMTIVITGPPLICAGGTGTLTATVSGGTAPYAYSWSSGLTSTSSTASISPLVSQTYTVYITDAKGCTDSGKIAINLGPLLFASITGSTSMCGGLSTTLCADAIGGTGGNTFLWEPGNITTPCITASPASTTTYTLLIGDDCGSNASTTATILINPAPVVNFSANVYQGCTPLCVQFYNTTTLAQGGLASYVWQFGDGDTSHAQSPVYCYSDTAKYSVSLTVVSDSGCSSTLTKSNIITAYQHPSAAFTYSPKPATILAPTIQFTDQSTDAYNILYWSWNFGDESDTTSKLQNPTHTYHDTGTYCANLIIMDAHGCTDTVTNCLVIEPNFNLYIPSAFSPNGDAKNPTFEPKGQYIQSFEMYIFDQWGMQLYHTTDLAKGWNGTVDGGGSMVSQEGVYIYKILVTDSQKKDHTYVGNVTLIK